MNDVLKDKNGNIMNPKIPRYEKLKNSTINSGKAIKCIQGSIVKTPAGTSIILFTMEELNELFGVSNCGTNNIVAFITNGDGNASSTHFDSTVILDGRLYATFTQTISKQIRINYLIFYIG